VAVLRKDAEALSVSIETREVLLLVGLENKATRLPYFVFEPCLNRSFTRVSERWIANVMRERCCLSTFTD